MTEHEMEDFTAEIFEMPEVRHFREKATRCEEAIGVLADEAISVAEGLQVAMEDACREAVRIAYERGVRDGIDKGAEVA